MTQIGAFFIYVEASEAWLQAAGALPATGSIWTTFGQQLDNNWTTCCPSVVQV